MEITEKKLFNKYPETQITFINKLNGSSWKKWKKFNEATPEEIKEANLRQIFPEEVVLDFETPDITEALNKLENKDWNYYLYDSGSRGKHIHIFFYGLDQYSQELRNKIRKTIIKEFNSDETKSSEATLVARFNKPHFKTLKEKTLIKEKEKFTVLPKEVLLKLRQESKATEFINNINLKDENFKDFHIKDPMFIYISQNKIPEGTARDINIFPSIATGLVKEGLTEPQIKALMEPIIKANFPGKNYNEFAGWVKKAFNNETDFNPIQLNNWIKQQTSFNQLYDLDPLKISLSSNKEIEDINIQDYINQPRKPNKWLIQDWISEGDISCLYGKPGSFKSTIIAHFCYAVCTGDMVFNKYATQKAKVLYLNAENHHDIMIPLLNRIIKGFPESEKEEKKRLIKENFFITTKKCTLSLENALDVNLIINLIKKRQATFVILDSLRRFFSSKENDSDTMNKLYKNLELIRQACGDVTIMLIHHTKKDSLDNQDGRDMARGSGDLIGFVDSSLYLRRVVGQNSVIITQTKNRGGEELVNKRIIIDKNEQDGFYIWETKDAPDKENRLSKVDAAIEEIMTLKEVKNLKEFNWDQLIEIKNNKGISHETIIRALRIMKMDGTINQIGLTRNVKYVFNNSV